MIFLFNCNRNCSLSTNENISNNGQLTVEIQNADEANGCNFFFAIFESSNPPATPADFADKIIAANYITIDNGKGQAIAVDLNDGKPKNLNPDTSYDIYGFIDTDKSIDLNDTAQIYPNQGDKVIKTSVSLIDTLFIQYEEFGNFDQ